jgi:hypothetical protein
MVSFQVMHDLWASHLKIQPELYMQILEIVKHVRDVASHQPDGTSLPSLKCQGVSEIVRHWAMEVRNELWTMRSQDANPSGAWVSKGFL